MQIFSCVLTQLLKDLLEVNIFKSTLFCMNENLYFFLWFSFRLRHHNEQRFNRLTSKTGCNCWKQNHLSTSANQIFCVDWVTVDITDNKLGSFFFSHYDSRMTNKSTLKYFISSEDHKVSKSPHEMRKLFYKQLQLHKGLNSGLKDPQFNALQTE